jgi:outer membrane protein assembly factor BamB
MRSTRDPIRQMKQPFPIGIILWLSFSCSFVSFVDNSCFADEGKAGWSTYRGNVQRTGNIDGQAGPATPKVLWAFKSQDHFVASPVPFGDRVLIAGLGGFNVPTFQCLFADPKAPQRTAWTKSTPYLKLPIVSSPAISDGKLIFGDGMHQTDGAVLHCLGLETGTPLWQLPLPGTLVHLEGSPTVAGSGVYIGGGSAGILCVQVDRVLLDGKELDLAGVQKILEERWKLLLVKYEQDKKKDPDFAVPPNDDQLPKPAPMKLWQQGAEQWHVDAPVAVAGDRVLVASAFLDKEMKGDRALLCLEAKTGKILWRTALKYNPWGGPSIAGDLVVVGGSTIGYDPKVVKQARGEIVALDLANGQVKWRKELSAAGIVSCVALSKDLAIACCTDGKVRAYQLNTGQLQWSYDAKAPLFAPPAVAGAVVYAGDLRGIVHAIDLAAGTPKWTLDLGAHAEVKAPGMIYGGPAVHAGRLFVATCNLEGPFARRPTVVVCIGEK